MLEQYFRTIIFDLRINKSRNDLPDFFFLKLSKRSQLVKMSSKEENFVRIVIPDSQRTSALSVDALSCEKPTSGTNRGMTYCWVLMLLAFGAAAGVGLVYGAGQDYSQLASSCSPTNGTLEAATETMNMENTIDTEDVETTAQLSSTVTINSTTTSTDFIRTTMLPETTTALMPNSTANRVPTSLKETKQGTTNV